LLLGFIEAARGNDSDADSSLRLAQAWAPDEGESLVLLSRLPIISESDKLRLLKDALRRGAGRNALSLILEIPAVLHDNEAKWIAETAISIAPYDSRVHDLLARVLREGGDQAAEAAEASLARMLRERHD
jgi:hypothetical protein